MLAIATMTVQLHDCGQGQVSCVVLHVVQCHVPFHCHDSDGWLCPACIIVCWKDTHTHTSDMQVYMHTLMHDGGFPMQDSTANSTYM